MICSALFFLVSSMFQILIKKETWGSQIGFCFFFQELIPHSDDPIGLANTVLLLFQAETKSLP